MRSVSGGVEHHTIVRELALEAAEKEVIKSANKRQGKAHSQALRLDLWVISRRRGRVPPFRRVTPPPVAAIRQVMDADCYPLWDISGSGCPAASTLGPTPTAPGSSPYKLSKARFSAESRRSSYPWSAGPTRPGRRLRHPASQCMEAYKAQRPRAPTNQCWRVVLRAARRLGLNGHHRVKIVPHRGGALQGPSSQRRH